MHLFTQPHIILTALLLFHTHATSARPQTTDKDIETFAPLRSGRYVPELHGADRGKYVPDESGKYHHVFVPYDGGYGDRGELYVHDDRGLPPRRSNGRGGFKLGPKDHLRFAIDFNYDGSGWQILQFEWVNDDDEKMNYKYEHKNRLWSKEGGSQFGGGANEDVDNNTNVHVSGEYQGDIYNVSYSNDNALNAPSQNNIQATIGEVLDYIQTIILPTLK